MEWLGTVWFWSALALLLFTLEAMAPGVLMLWFGLAAIVTAILVGGLSMSTPTQWIVFSVLAIFAAGLGWRYRRAAGGHRQAGPEQAGQHVARPGPRAGPADRQRPRPAEDR